MISALIIAKNEEANIGSCLESLKDLAGEIVVVVDSASNDRTEEISRLSGAKVFVKEWLGYSRTKSWGLEQTTGEYVLWIDADERLTSELAEEIKRTMTEGREFAALSFPRKAFFLDRWIKHCGWYPGYVTRFFARERATFDEKEVHEGLTVDGAVIRLKNPLLHYTDPDLSHYMKKLNHYTQLAASQMHGGGRRFKVSDVIIKPPAFFFKMYILKLGWLDGLPGFILSVLSSYYVLTKYLKLWELELGEGRLES